MSSADETEQRLRYSEDSSSATEDDEIRSNSSEEEDDFSDDPESTDLRRVKELSQIYRLTTRRPSVVQWKQTLQDKKWGGGNKEERGVVRCLNRLASVQESADDASKRDDDITMDGGNHLDISDDGSSTEATSGCCMGESETMTKEDDELERINRITQQLQEIQNQLILMRIQDNQLARDLLGVRKKINIYKAEQSCDMHAEMLDDVACELEEEEELTAMTRLYKACDLSDRPPAFLLTSFTPLRNIGVSKMNLNERRFSIR